MLRFALLGSGSRGNAALVASQKTLLMVDCGFSLTETERRLARLGVSAEDIDATLVTHEHSDHIAGVGKLARRYGMPVWMTHGTHRACKDRNVPGLAFVNPHQSFAIGDIEIQPYPVPHDAHEPCQYVFSHRGQRLGVLSDSGAITPHICEQLGGCDALLLECNHDPDMLASGPYSMTLKQRVAGPLGHLSNSQSASLLMKLDTDAMQHIAITHISETNNTPALARAAVASALDQHPARISLADQDNGLPWTEIHS